jgi:carbonic anhydrase
MLNKEELEANNRRFGAAYMGGQLSHVPARKLLVLTCMDTRMDPLRILGLRDGDAHIIRNAGGRVSDDAIRSIVISQQVLGTRQLVVMHHTRCGLLNVTNDELLQKMSPALRSNLSGIDFLPLGPDLNASVRDDVLRLRRHGLLSPESEVLGFVYDVATGRISRVD